MKRNHIQSFNEHQQNTDIPDYEHIDYPPITDKKKRIALKNALETVLVIAEDRLTHAISKNNEWEIKLYKYDIAKIKNQLEGL